jgi:hypothetical protein
MKNKRQVKILLDDGGGYAMAVYANKYASNIMITGDQVADMLIAVMDGHDASDWDNNMWGKNTTSSDPSCRDYVGTAYQVAREIVRDYRNDNIYGANHTELAIALIRARKNGEW